MTTSHEKTEWYAGPTGNHQGLVSDSITGRNVAVTYDAKDAPIVAAAPRMLKLLKSFAMGSTDPHVNASINREASQLIYELAGEVVDRCGAENEVEIRNFVVLYREPESQPYEPPLGFKCLASNAEHAEEQCKNSYPSCDIVWVWEGENGIGISSALRDYYRSGLKGWVHTQTHDQYVDFDRELFSFPDEGSTSIDMKLTFNLETRDCHFTIRTANNSGEIQEWARDYKLPWSTAIDMLRKDGVQLPVELENPIAQYEDDSALTAEQLDDKYNQDGGGQHPIHTRLAWAQEVGEQNTLLGYWHWVEHQIEASADDESEAKPSLPRIVETPGLQWLVLPDESENGYTNWGDLSPHDASHMVTVVNSHPSLGLGRNDWRLPTVEELLPLVGTQHAPKDGAYWTSCLCADDSDLAQVVDFSVGSKQAYHRNDDICSVRLVRSIQ